MDAPGGVGNDHQRAHSLVISQEEIQHGEFLAGRTARQIELHKMQARRLRQLGRIEQLCRRIADHGRVKVGIASPAYGRGSSIAIVNTFNTE